jgi:hypothetical protein
LYLQAISWLTALQVLYLHGNQLTSIKDVTLLASLTKLQKLSLHGNELVKQEEGKEKVVKRLEETPYYRHRVILELRHTNLKQLDFVTITPRDREHSLVYESNFKKKLSENNKNKNEDDDTSSQHSSSTSASPSRYTSTFSKVGRSIASNNYRKT